jgi:hypothetical protein
VPETPSGLGEGLGQQQGAEAKATGAAGVKLYEAPELEPGLTARMMAWSRSRPELDSADIFRDAVIHFFEEDGRDKENLLSGQNLYRFRRVDSYSQAEDIYILFSRELLDREGEFVGLADSEQAEFDAFMDGVVGDLLPRLQAILDRNPE